MRLVPFNPPGFIRNAVISGALDHVGSAQSLGVRDIPGGVSSPQVYNLSPGLIAAGCRDSNFPNIFWKVEQ